MREISGYRVKHKLSELVKISSNWTKILKAGLERKRRDMLRFESLALKENQVGGGFPLKNVSIWWLNA